VDEARPTIGLCVPDGCIEEDLVRNLVSFGGGLQWLNYEVSCQTKKDQDQIKEWHFTTYMTM